MSSKKKQQQKTTKQQSLSHYHQGEDRELVCSVCGSHIFRPIHDKAINHVDIWDKRLHLHVYTEIRGVNVLILSLSCRHAAETSTAYLEILQWLSSMEYHNITLSKFSI
jgi:hypothetical protein